MSSRPKAKNKIFFYIVLFCFAATLTFIVCLINPTHLAQFFGITLPDETATTESGNETIASTDPAINVAPKNVNITIYYLSDGDIHKFNHLQNTDDILNLSESKITNAAISPDRKWLTFSTGEGFYLTDLENTDKVEVISDKASEHASFSFNNQGNMLAFSDHEGLKLFDLNSKSTTLLFANVNIVYDDSGQIIGDVNDFRNYSPLLWSPDDRWLWVSEGVSEGSYRVLVDLESDVNYSFSSCNDTIDWLSSSQGFYTSVSTSGYASCGDDDGIFFESPRQDGKVDETNLYQATHPDEHAFRESYDVQLSPDETKLCFVQGFDIYSDNPTYSLISMNIDGTDQRELVTGKEKIRSPKWSMDSSKIVFIQDSEHSSSVKVIDLNSNEISILIEFPNKIEYQTQIEGTDWFLFGIEVVSGKGYGSPYLVNTKDGTVTALPIPGFQMIIGMFMG
jgi:Tol biopolymer transport system component